MCNSSKILCFPALTPDSEVCQNALSPIAHNITCNVAVAGVTRLVAYLLAVYLSGQEASAMTEA